jgi:hypothetical protein
VESDFGEEVAFHMYFFILGDVDIFVDGGEKGRNGGG